MQKFNATAKTYARIILSRDEKRELRKLALKQFEAKILKISDEDLPRNETKAVRRSR